MKTSSLISKLQKNQLKKDFPLFISLMKKDISSSNVKADSFRESYLKKTAFSKLRVYKLFIKAEQYHEKTLLRKGFISWV